MYEDVTYDAILARMLGRVPDDLDKREGSVIYDALAPAAIELQLMYLNYLNLVLLMMLFYSLCSIEKKSKMDRNVKICSGLFSMLMILIVILALQISWTPDNSLIVVGVQGRYFLPILPMILLAMKDLLTVKAENTNIILFYGNIILHISEIFAILCIVIGR